MPTDALPPLSRQFIAHFGEMGSKWGINRTVGQIYALIFISERALNADEIAEALAFSRSNVSMGLKELQSWRLVRLRHQPGDRREYFEAETDIWKMISRVMRERELTQIERTLEVFERAREKLRTLPLPGERTRLDDIADRLGKLVDLARVGRGLLVALVQQGRVDLGPLMRFARPRR